MQSLLQELLDLGLVEIGDNDAWYDYLETATEKLAQYFLAHPAQAIPGILVALDEDADENEPSFQYAEDILRENWKSLRGRFKERPRSLLRIIIFAALERAAEQSPSLSAALWLTVNPIHAHLKLGKEREPVARVLAGYAERLEQSSISLRDDETPLEPPALSPAALPPLPKLKNAVINTADYLERIFSAVGPSTPNNTTLPNPNPYWPNNNQHWSWSFAPIMNEVLVSAVNQGSQEISQQINDYNAKYNDAVVASFKKQANHLTDISKQIINQINQSSRAVKLKSDVLWWLEALYSQTLRSGYRQLSPQLAVIAMSYDLFRVVEAHLPAPASVVHVLGEAVNRLKDTGYDRLYSLLDTLQQVHTQRSQLRALVASPPDITGRRPLLHVIESSVHQGAPTAQELRDQTGLRGDEALSMPELAMWCFQDLQARTLCKTKERA